MDFSTDYCKIKNIFRSRFPAERAKRHGSHHPLLMRKRSASTIGSARLRTGESHLCSRDITCPIQFCSKVRRHEYFRHFNWERLRRGQMTSQLLIYLLRKNQIMPRNNTQKDQNSVSHPSKRDRSGRRTSQKSRDEKGGSPIVANSQDDDVWINF